MNVTIVAELQFIVLNIPHRYSKGFSSSLTEDSKEDKQAPPSHSHLNTNTYLMKFAFNKE